MRRDGISYKMVSRERIAYPQGNNLVRAGIKKVRINPNWCDFHVKESLTHKVASHVASRLASRLQNPMSCKPHYNSLYIQGWIHGFYSTKTKLIV
jgi:hypothetical protein